MSSTHSANGSILLLDSDPLTRTILQEALHGAGYLADAAGDIGVAVDHLKHCRPDLLIVRPYINSMTGAMAAKYLRTRCPGLCVLMVGGMMTDDRIRTQNDVNDIQIFPGPFACGDLLEKVRDVFVALHGRRR